MKKSFPIMTFQEISNKSRILVLNQLRNFLRHWFKVEKNTPHFYFIYRVKKITHTMIWGTVCSILDLSQRTILIICMYTYPHDKRLNGILPLFQRPSVQQRVEVTSILFTLISYLSLFNRTYIILDINIRFYVCVCTYQIFGYIIPIYREDTMKFR